MSSWHQLREEQTGIPTEHDLLPRTIDSIKQITYEGHIYDLWICFIKVKTSAKHTKLVDLATKNQTFYRVSDS